VLTKKTCGIDLKGMHTIEQNDCIPFRRHFKYLFDLWSEMGSIGSKIFGLKVVKRTSGPVGN
jgi:hypothetical protein